MMPIRSMQSLENIESYHQVFASSLAEIISKIAIKDFESAKALIRYNIWYAYAMHSCEDPETQIKTINEGISKMKLDKMDLPELVVMMTYYQSKAGLKPVQERDMKARMFERFMEKEGDDA